MCQPPVCLTRYSILTDLSAENFAQKSAAIMEKSM